jgi:hypothetical protein
LPGYQTITNNLFRIMLTADAKAVAKSIGFSRKAWERRFRDQCGRLLRKLDKKIFSGTRYSGFSREIIKSRILNSNYMNMPPTSDNGVNANYWMDSNCMGYKVNIPITSFGLRTPNDGVCFQNISDIFVHIALSTRALSEDRREISDAGAEFYAAVSDISSGKYSHMKLREKIIEYSNRNKI